LQELCLSTSLFASIKPRETQETAVRLLLFAREGLTPSVHSARAFSCARGRRSAQQAKEKKERYGKRKKVD